MNSIVAVPPPAAGAARGASRLAEIVLVRLAAGAASEQQLIRDLQAMLPANERNDAAGTIVRAVQLAASTGHVVRRSETWALTDAGAGAVGEFLGRRDLPVPSWPEVRDGALVLAALGMKNAPAQRRKAVAKADGLAALIVEAHFDLRLKGKPSAARIRHALALIALERAFGNQLKSEIGEKSALSAKASRLLAARLSRNPRDFGTDGRLVSALAAEAVGARKATLAELRAGVLRRYLAAEAPGAPTPAAADRNDAATPLPPMPPADPRPDLAGFAAAALRAAADCAEGWPGNRRAYVSQAFARLTAAHPGWGLSEIEFKAMLTEAHRRGLVVLAHADLKDKRRLKDVQDSAISYKNTVWHFIRCDG